MPSLTDRCQRTRALSENQRRSKHGRSIVADESHQLDQPAWRGAVPELGRTAVAHWVGGLVQVLAPRTAGSSVSISLMPGCRRQYAMNASKLMCCRCRTESDPKSFAIPLDRPNRIPPLPAGRALTTQHTHSHAIIQCTRAGHNPHRRPGPFVPYASHTEVAKKVHSGRRKVASSTGRWRVRARARARACHAVPASPAEDALLSDRPLRSLCRSLPS